MQIGFIGLGKLGMPCAEMIASKNHLVEGYDIATVYSKNVCVTDSIQSAVYEKKIVFVAVPTPHNEQYDGAKPTVHLPPKDFSYDIVKLVLRECNRFMTEDQLLVLISTVLPGTVRNELIPLITNTKFIYNPYLIAMGSVGWDMVNPEMIMIGTSDGNETGDAVELIHFYKTIMENNPRYVVGTWDECECIKVFYNTFISAKLSLVNMIQDVAERQENINVDVVTKALAESNMRIMGKQYMTAGMGDGGACHPRDNIALRYIAEKLDLGYDLFGGIIHAREMQAKNMADTIVNFAKVNKMPVVIHGKAYKPNVPYEDGSYSKLVGYYVKSAGVHDLYYVDPQTDDYYTPDSPCVFLLAHSPTITYNYTGKDYQDKIYCNIPPGSIVIDPWRKFEKDNVTVIHYGNTRKTQ